MPASIPRACRVRGCAGTTTERHGYCEAHAHKAKAWSSGRAGRGRGGRPWRRIRERIKERDKGLCQICLKAGLMVPGTICDHIIPEAEGGRTTDDNLQMICRKCNDRKTQQESQRARARNS
ncbi:HNH endonuclease signature motif containing protein [Neptuniibacter sp.]|uniref:HNH endonuclease n=1 Tax=Neptuniibacter sp. TaxID=1962643 RepID=UPI002608AC3F|nr:HNH endonuclease signature motif containing protein [Neptuniibacter sp.]MCP4597784.1 HNH endonuclease [Neptuniibacter sp.]